MPEGTRNPAGGWRPLSLRGAFMVDSTRGQLRIRSWPKPRPGQRHETNEFWSRWLKGITYVYRYQPASVQWQLQEATKGTVWMPRDVFISAARGRAWLLQDEQGHKYFPMVFYREVSDSLDAVAQLPGQMLFRGTDLWIPIPSGNPGEVLTYVSDADAPSWEPGGGTGYSRNLIYNANLNPQTINVNSTSYVALEQLAFDWDWDEFSPAAFRITGRLSSANVAGSTVTLQLATFAAPGTPLSAAGDDLTAGLTMADVDSGWIDIAAGPSAFAKMCLATKGSTSTSDITLVRAEIHFR